jgi:hypothetical protein
MKLKYKLQSTLNAKEAVSFPCRNKSFRCIVKDTVMKLWGMKCAGTPDSISCESKIFPLSGGGEKKNCMK